MIQTRPDNRCSAGRLLRVNQQREVCSSERRPCGRHGPAMGAWRVHDLYTVRRPALLGVRGGPSSRSREAVYRRRGEGHHDGHHGTCKQGGTRLGQAAHRAVRFVILTNRRWMTRKRRHLHGHIREQRQAGQNGMKFVVRVDIEDAEIRILADHAMQLLPLPSPLTVDRCGNTALSCRLCMRVMRCFRICLRKAVGPSSTCHRMRRAAFDACLLRQLEAASTR